MKLLVVIYIYIYKLNVIKAKAYYHYELNVIKGAVVSQIQEPKDNFTPQFQQIRKQISTEYT